VNVGQLRAILAPLDSELPVHVLYLPIGSALIRSALPAASAWVNANGDGEVLGAAKGVTIVGRS
jgi:hypothetical protein